MRNVQDPRLGDLDGGRARIHQRDLRRAIRHHRKGRIRTLLADDDVWLVLLEQALAACVAGSGLQSVSY
jgi:hypothetical protein